MRQRVHNHFTIATKIRALVHHLRLTHKMGWKTSLRGWVGDGMGVVWGISIPAHGRGWNTNIAGWALTEAKVDRDGWGWKLNQRVWVGMGVISVPVQVSNSKVIAQTHIHANAGLYLDN